MRIKSEIITRINNVESRRKISAAIGISDQMLYKHMVQNNPDGALTKIRALVAIAEDTGMVIPDLLDQPLPIALFKTKAK